MMSGQHVGMVITVATATVCAALVATSGCSPKDYRLAADRETYAILQERAKMINEALGKLSIDPPPESRLHDPFDPDHPPLPPDDPAAHTFMNEVYGMKAYRKWDKHGTADSVEDPAWRQKLEFDDQGHVVLSPQRAVNLGLLHSRDYQTALEDMFATALFLTLERFEFDVQLFARNTTFAERSGASSAGNDSSNVTSDTSVGFTKSFATGAQLLVDFANSVVLEFSGDDEVTVSSSLLVSLIQPILRGAGRNIRLEALTQAERDVLYSVRDFARFRKQFYFDLVFADDGYLLLLLQLQSIRNFEANLESLRKNLEIHSALAEAGVVSPLQVDQVFQSYQSGRLDLIAARNDLETTLDDYLIQLGLPPDLPVVIDDSLLDPFRLTSPAIEQLDRDVEALTAEIRQIGDAATLEQVRQVSTATIQIQDRLRLAVDEVAAEVDRWRVPLDGDDDEDAQQAAVTRQQLVTRLSATTDEFKTIGQAAAALTDPKPADWPAVQRLVQRQSNLVASLFVVQTQVRAFLIELEPVAFVDENAVAYAIEHRLDLMNQQARVVDEWRRIAVAADALEGDVDVVLEANLGTDPLSDNPFEFEAQASRYRAGLRIDAPLTRQAERNNYRLQLIRYQRARRTLMLSADSIVGDVRRDWRELTAARLNFTIARQSLIIAARQVDLAREQLLAPGGGGDSSTTADLLDALNSLLEAKNEMIEIWVTYETERLRLLLDTEALMLDENWRISHDEAH